MRLADLTVNTIELNGYEFANCRILGPAVILPLGSTTIANCGWDAPGMDAIFWEVTAGRNAIVGAIAVRDCIFSGCTFQNVGLAGPASLRQILEAGFSG